jgi:4-aminobutyrate aminotransferase-like enzyme/Ser/Thr protein kinase RdoA (MazF antagonist)
MRTPVALTFDTPNLSLPEAEAIAARHFGVRGRASALPGERDRNLLICGDDGSRAVLKVSHAAEDRRDLELQHAVLDHLARRAPGLQVPRVLRQPGGEDLATVPIEGRPHLVRCLGWIDGRMLAESSPHDASLLESLGEMLGTLTAALQGFDHPGARRPLKWDLAHAGWIREHLAAVADPGRRALAERFLARYEAAGRAIGALRRSIAYNDANDYNVVVASPGGGARQVVGVIDFGDVLETITVADLAIGVAYAMLHKPDPLMAAAAVVRGYHRRFALREAELELLFTLAGARLAVSVVNAAVQRIARPDNAYLTISEAPAWALLERLDLIAPAFAHYVFRDACGLEPCPRTAHVVGWLRAGSFARLPVRPSARPPVRFDLSIGSPEVGTLDQVRDQVRLDGVLTDRLREAGASVGIGHYDEARAFYTDDRFRIEGNEGPVWRTVHIGVDLWVPAGTPVVAPLAGTVHALRNNAGAGDYGPTIILRHDADGVPFFTLYGHLARGSLSRLTVGQAVAAGDLIAETGEMEENGGWSPHLHFQVITDLLGRDGEFPGVARADQRAVWLSLSPDPNLVLGLPGGVRAPRAAPTATLLAERRERLGPSLSISYRRPLTIVRGFRQFLYDADGRAYLDAVNNVPHVGHQHPRVVHAAQAQAAVLNTNTRYLHPTILRLAERLTATLPEPLRVCYFVNSGSEANELAVRLARAATGRRGMVVVDVGYHGNTSTLVELSPYKYDGPGGSGQVPWVEKVPMPDGYRGPFKSSDPGAGARYAEALDGAIANLTARDFPPAAFLVESILSCGGQVPHPPGYLAEAFRRMRAAGGVCIADEVQTGFGRMGSRFWGFETQGVVPDIVTMGKPMGNGHPIGAVVTTPEIARAFANGMEYFSTFGGNPVSCAIALAVLDVIGDEGLQQNALDVGNYLIEGLRALAPRHAIVGDVRGIGLFTGIEFVRDRSTLEPADREAAYVANRMRDFGVLVSTDGPFHNVIKIKPPLVFTRDDADALVATMDRVLGEDPIRYV